MERLQERVGGGENAGETGAGKDTLSSFLRSYMRIVCGRCRKSSEPRPTLAAFMSAGRVSRCKVFSYAQNTMNSCLH